MSDQKTFIYNKKPAQLTPTLLYITKKDKNDALIYYLILCMNLLASCSASNWFYFMVIIMKNIS